MTTTNALTTALVGKRLTQPKAEQSTTAATRIHTVRACSAENSATVVVQLEELKTTVRGRDWHERLEVRVQRSLNAGTDGWTERANAAPAPDEADRFTTAITTIRTQLACP